MSNISRGISREAEDLLLAFYDSQTHGERFTHPEEVSSEYAIVARLRSSGEFSRVMQELWDADFYAILDDDAPHFLEGLTGPATTLATKLLADGRMIETDENYPGLGISRPADVNDRDYLLKRYETTRRQLLDYFQGGGSAKDFSPILSATTIARILAGDEVGRLQKERLVWIMTESAMPMAKTGSDEELLGQARVDSATWTGVKKRVAADSSIVVRVKSHIYQIDNLIELAEMSNHDKQQAKSITESLKILIESPDPEWKAIIELLLSPALVAAATYVGLILAILGLTK